MNWLQLERLRHRVCRSNNGYGFFRFGGKEMKRANVWRVTVVGVLAALSLIVASCGSSSSSSSSSSSTTTTAKLPTSWELPGADAQNTRAVGGPINAGNVATLGVAWTVPIQASGTFGAYATTPVVSDGVLYTQDLASNV